jgi:hypothetical protein
MSIVGNIKFSYYDKVDDIVRDNNLINILGTWYSIVIYFDQNDIFNIIPILNNETSNNSSTFGTIYNITNQEISSVRLIPNKKYIPPDIRPINIISTNIFQQVIYLNGHLTQFLPDSIFSPSYIFYPSYLDIINPNKNSIKDIEDIKKITILNPSIIDIIRPNKLPLQPYILSVDPLNATSCGQIGKSSNGISTLINIKDPCYLPGTQLIYTENLDAYIIDYSKPYPIMKLYDDNNNEIKINNEIKNNPVNYSKVTQIAFYMSDTPEPYPPPNYIPIPEPYPQPNYIPIIVIIFIILSIIGGLVYYFMFDEQKGGLFKLGE